MPDSEIHIFYTPHLPFAWEPKAIQLRRAKLQMVNSKSMLIADAFTGNFAHKSGEDLRREQWGKENNTLLPLKPPGGWSACGQPCDGIHHMYRRLVNRYIDSTLGDSASLTHCVAIFLILLTFFFFILRQVFYCNLLGHP